MHYTSRRNLGARVSTELPGGQEEEVQAAGAGGAEGREGTAMGTRGSVACLGGGRFGVRCSPWDRVSKLA